MFQADSRRKVCLVLFIESLRIISIFVFGTFLNSNPEKFVEVFLQTQHQLIRLIGGLLKTAWLQSTTTLLPSYSLYLQFSLSLSNPTKLSISFYKWSTKIFPESTILSKVFSWKGSILIFMLILLYISVFLHLPILTIP